MSRNSQIELAGRNRRGAPTDVQIRDLAVSFETKKRRVAALGPISLDMGPGETLAIVGPTGCGKSTLLRSIAGLIEPSTGDVKIGQEIVDGPLRDTGIVFQNDLLVDWRDVLGNIMLTPEIQRANKAAARKRALELLDLLGLSGFEEARPWELSGGMRQRVAICRALVLDPSLLLLDEPFSALDALTRDQMSITLQRAQSETNSTALLITHSIEEAVFLGDRVIVMSTRPGTAIAEFTVPFVRPRSLSIRTESAFVELTGDIRAHFESMGVLGNDE